jgi:hypothetical protein
MIMLVKVSELSGVQLDWVVAHCEGKELHYFTEDWFKKDPWLSVNGEADQPLHSYTPSTTWGQGGPIIQRERIRLDPRGLWCAAHDSCEWAYYDGPTPLIAAMRCYVASKLGEEVDVPDELLNALEA